MGKTETEKLFRWRSDYVDYSLIAVVIILICFGLVMLYSASSYEAVVQQGDDMYYLKRQALFTVIFVAVMFFAAKVNYHFWIRLAPAFFVLSLVLMFMVKFTPLGITGGGAKRWLGYGKISFQPSEFAKIAVILFTVYMIYRLGKRFMDVGGYFTILLLDLLPAAAAFFLTDNLSTAIIIFGISYILLFLSHPQKKWSILVLAFVIAGVVFVLTAGPSVFNDFRMERVLVWQNPEQYSDLGGYQVLQGLYAIGSGGFFGNGLGNSSQKLATIPEAQNDMIFSIICEELGIFGAIILLLLFGYLIYRIYWISQHASDLKGSLIASGVMTHISLQVILNICVVLNVIPTTGVTLPFVSYGGTSVFFLLFEIAMVVNVSSYIPLPGRSAKDTRVKPENTVPFKK